MVETSRCTGVPARTERGINRSHMPVFSMAAHTDGDANVPDIKRIRVAGPAASRAEIETSFRQLDDAMRRLMTAWRGRDRLASPPQDPMTVPEIQSAEQSFEAAKLRFFKLVAADEAEASEGQARDGEHEEEQAVRQPMG